MRNLVCPDAQTGHQTTVYSSQHFKFNENTKMCPLLPSPSSPRACTQAYTICKCCSDSLKFIRTSRAWVNNCSTSLSSTALVSSALSSVYGQQLFGRQQFKAAPSISGTSPQKNWAKDIPDQHHLFLLIHITAWHLLPSHSASYDRGSFRKQPHLHFPGSLLLRAVEKEQVRQRQRISGGALWDQFLPATIAPDACTVQVSCVQGWDALV